MMHMPRQNAIHANGGRGLSSSQHRLAAFARRRAVGCRSSAPTATEAASAPSPALFADLDEAVVAYRKAPPSQKLEFSADVKAAFDALSAAGALPKWGAGTEVLPARRPIMTGELRQMGIKNPEQLAVPSTRNDAAFLTSVVLGFSVLAVLLGQLPGDWVRLFVWWWWGMCVCVCARNLFLLIQSLTQLYNLSQPFKTNRASSPRT
jgi:hypothetical protein